MQQKFCPDRLDVVNATLSRVIERARLAIVPKKREDARVCFGVFQYNRRERDLVKLNRAKA